VGVGVLGHAVGVLRNRARPLPGVGVGCLGLFGISIVDASIFVVVLLCRPRVPAHSFELWVGG
jgi:hypothetical protein